MFVPVPLDPRAKVDRRHFKRFFNESHIIQANSIRIPSWQSIFGTVSNLEFCKVRWHRDRKTLPFENQQKKLTMINLLNRMENCCARLIKIVRNGRLQRIAEKKRKGQDKSVMAFKF